MTHAMSSSSDGRSLEEVKQNQVDRLDEMQKLDGDVICLNSAYIDILDRITNKLDMLAHLAEEVESDARLHPQSMEDGLKSRFDLLSQSALLNRFMCTKAVYQNAVGSIQAISQFGSSYIDNGTNGAPFHPSTSECTENPSQEPRHSDASGDTLASDSDATVAARMDISDSQLSVTEDEIVATDDGPSTSVPPQSLHAPSTLQLEEEDIKAFVAKELEEIRIEEEKDALATELTEIIPVEIPKDPSENVVSSSSALSVRSMDWSRDGDGRRSVADSVHSFESMVSVEEEVKRKKKRKNKRSKSAEQRRRTREAEKMENILNKHLKRSMEKQPKVVKNRMEETMRMSPPAASSPPLKDIEVVTISDEEPVTQIKSSRVDEDYEEIISGHLGSRVLPGPMTPTEKEDCENYPFSCDEIREMKSGIENTPLCASGQVLSAIVHPPNVRPSVPQPVPPPPPFPPPPPDRYQGFIAASIPEPQMASSSSLAGEGPATADPNSSFSERSMMMLERPETRDGEGEDQDNDRILDEICGSRESLVDNFSESIRQRGIASNSPDIEKTGLSRSLSYSPSGASRSRDNETVERSPIRSGEKSRSRSRERREWRWAPTFRYGYRPRYRRWSRSPTRSRSRSRHRSNSRERDDSRNRSMSRSRSRSMSRNRSRSISRSISRGRSVSPSSPVGRNASSPPRAYAQSFYRSKREEGRRERRREEKKMKEDEFVEMEVEERSSTPQLDTGRVRTSSPPPSLVLDPPPPAPILPLSPSPQPHSGSSSPSIFVPPPPIILPKPTPLKISIPTTLSIKTRVGCASGSGCSSSTSLVANAPLPPSESAETKEGTLHKDHTKHVINRTGDSSSDMSLEGNTVSEGSNGEGKGKKGEQDIASIPTPPLSNPSAMENKSTEGSECMVPVGTQPSLPPHPPPLINRSVDTTPLPATTPSRVLSTPTPSPFISTPIGGVMGSRGSATRAISGPIPIYPLIGGPHPNQYYANMPPHNPYGPHPSWMHQDPQWQQYYYNGYNQDPGMMGLGYGNPSVSHHPSVLTQGPMPEAHGSFMKAMRVIPSSINSQPAPDWAQMAREHANQQLHVACVPPPPPPLNQQGHLMGHIVPYGTPQVGRGGGSRFRGGGGKGRRRW